MSRKRKIRKDTTKVHPLFSGDREYVESLLPPEPEPPAPRELSNKNFRDVTGYRRKLKAVATSEWVAAFPAKPKALRKIAKALRELDQGTPFTIAEWELARHAGVSVRTLARYMPVFENYGVVEVKRWRYRLYGPTPNTYHVFLGAVIPPDWTFGGGDFAISARQAA